MMIDHRPHPHLIYSVNTDLDSWDIENLRYIRKISIRDSADDSNNETLSYVSEDDQQDDHQDGQQLTTTSGFVLKSSSSSLPKAANYRQAPAHPTSSALPARVLEEELPKYVENKSQLFSACYLMDVLLVTNESLPPLPEHPQQLPSPTPALSPSICSADSFGSFASAIRKGFFDMEQSEEQQEHPAENNQDNNKEQQQRRVKKSVSFMDETIQIQPPPPQKNHDNQQKRMLVRRGASFTGTSSSVPVTKPILNHRCVQRYTAQAQKAAYQTLQQLPKRPPPPQFELEPSVPWTGKIVGSDAFQLGYANNWASLETYVRRLQHTNSL